MKLIILLLISPIICIAQEDKINELEEYGINGPVKSYIEYTALQADCFENVEEGARKSSFYCSANKSERVELTFNKNGGLIKSEGYRQTDNDFNEKTKLLKTFTTTYDGFGKKIEHIKYDYGSVESRSSFKYDTKGNELEESIYEYKDVLSEKNIYKYDNNDNLLEESYYEYYSSGEISFSYEWYYNYNEDGDLTEEKEYINGEFESATVYNLPNIYNYSMVEAYGSDGKLIATAFIGKDEDDKVLSRRIKNSDDKLFMDLKFQYSDSGVLQQKITNTYNEGEEIRKKETKKYNIEGNLIESITYWYEDKSEKKLLYKYNEDEYLIEIITIKNGIITDKKEYKHYFDEYDNLIWKIEYLNGRAMHVTEIEIKYF